MRKMKSSPDTLEAGPCWALAEHEHFHWKSDTVTDHSILHEHRQHIAQTLEITNFAPNLADMSDHCLLHYIEVPSHFFFA